MLQAWNRGKKHELDSHMIRKIKTQEGKKSPLQPYFDFSTCIEDYLNHRMVDVGRDIICSKMFISSLNHSRFCCNKAGSVIVVEHAPKAWTTFLWGFYLP